MNFRFLNSTRNILLGIMLLANSIAIAQTHNLKGVVISSEDNLPIPGATIIVDGITTLGTTTDFDGIFEIEIPDSTHKVTVSFIGMETQDISVQGKTEINVTLNPESINVEEVVVSVPYAQTSKKDFSGSIGVISNDKLNQGAENVDKLLQGSTSGVVSGAASGQPGAKNEIRIRGIGSFNAGNEPLYVVDGIPLANHSDDGNTLSFINSNDIESITVCKDASAASLYGSRASNGVIIITTKSGSKNKTKYTLSTQHGFSQICNNDFSVLNTDEYLTLRRESMQNAGLAEEDIIAALGSENVNTDWFDEVFRTTYNSNYEISASGGSDKMNFYISGAYKDENGIIIGTDLNRLALRLNVDYKASDKFELGAKVNGAFVKQNLIDESGALSSPIVGAYVLAPNIPVYLSNGSYYFENETQNVVGTTALNCNEKKEYSFLGNMYAKYNFTDELSFKTTFAGDFLHSDLWKLIHPQTPDGKSVNGTGQKSQILGISKTSSNILNFDKKFDKGNSFNILAGFEVQDFHQEAITNVAQDFAENGSFSMQSASVITTPWEETGEWSIVSYLAKTAYNIGGKYQITGSFRRDDCSRFSSNNRSGYFWSAGAYWRISDENFLVDNEYINNIKLRISYGTSGNAEIGNYASLYLYSFGENYNSQTGSYLSQLGNDDLTWEKNNNADLGLDFRIFQRFSGSLELYHRRTWDLLMNVPISLINGAEYQLRNYGEMVNKGIEITLSSENIKKPNFNWNTDFNISFNKNEVTKLYNGSDIEGQTQIHREGEAYYTFYLPEWAGVNPADGSAMWYDKNGQLTTDYSQAAKKIAGKADPKFISALTNTISYKNFDLSFMFFLSFGGKVYNAINQRMISDGSLGAINQSHEAMNRWQHEGDVTDVPKIVYNNGSNSNEISTRYLEDGTYLRLKNVKLSYDINRKTLEKVKLSMCKIFVQGSNLWTWTKYSGIDPEVGVNGLDNFAYPSVRSISAGLTLSF